MIGGSDVLALGALAHELAVAPDGLGLLSGSPLGGLLVVPAHPHLPIETFALHLLLERTERLVDIVVAYLNLDNDPNSSWPVSRTTKTGPSFES